MQTGDATNEQAWTRVRSPFDIRQWKRAHAQAVEGDVPLHITTAGQPWHFAVSFAADRASRDRSAPAVRLAVVRVPDEPGGTPEVRYFLQPFDGYELHLAQTYVPLDVHDLLPFAVEPQ